MSKKRVLWLGFGDLAARTLPQLNLDVYDVSVVSRSEKHCPLGVTQKLGDVRNAESLLPLLSTKPEYVVVTLTPGARGRDAYRATYVESLSNLLFCLEQVAHAPKKIIFTSSTSVYHQQNGEWVDEDSPTQPTSETAQELLRAEQSLRDSGLPHVCIRFSGIYGEGRNYLMRSVIAGKAPGTHWSNRIHSEDCANVIKFIIEETEKAKSLPSILLGSDHEPVRISDVYTWLATKLGLSVPHPNTVTDENRKRLNKRCNSKRLRELGFVFEYPNYRLGYEKQVEQYVNGQQ